MEKAAISPVHFNLGNWEVPGEGSQFIFGARQPKLKKQRENTRFAATKLFLQLLLKTGEKKGASNNTSAGPGCSAYARTTR